MSNEPESPKLSIPAMVIEPVTGPEPVTKRDPDITNEGSELPLRNRVLVVSL